MHNLFRATHSHNPYDSLEELAAAELSPVPVELVLSAEELSVTLVVSVLAALALTEELEAALVLSVPAELVLTEELEAEEVSSEEVEVAVLSAVFTT